MERARVDGVELEYEVAGTGEPVLLIHGSHIADSFRPLMDEAALTGEFQLIRYHRRGFAGSTRPTGPVTIADQAADVRALLDHLGVEGAHLAGHSYGGAIALELAASTPERARSLALLEPALLDVPSGPAIAEALGALVEQYAGGDPTGAVDAFLASIGREDLSVIDKTVPGGLAQARRDAATFFEIELAALPEWVFDAERAKAIPCSVLSVVGSDTLPAFFEGRDVLRGWFPGCAEADIPGASHFLQMEEPRAVAETLAAFFSKVPTQG